MKHHLPRILTFVALILLGFALLPRLPFQLQPSRTLPSLTVSYAWANASGELLERQVTSKLEAIFATLRGLENLTSMSINSPSCIPPHKTLPSFDGEIL